jgi:hypothetical protein
VSTSTWRTPAGKRRRYDAVSDGVLAARGADPAGTAGRVLGLGLASIAPMNGLTTAETVNHPRRTLATSGMLPGCGSSGRLTRLNIEMALYD